PSTAQKSGWWHHRQISSRCLWLIKAMYRLESAVLGAASGYAALSNSGINVGDRELGLPCPVRE
ncbi:MULTISPECIES: hypothetical protein, partial [unclassified Ensifer]|uniref:hypothetical protein n=1 Tax=unclassified Ensifer TaxID=2633371 RepID=UPI00300F8762